MQVRGVTELFILKQYLNVKLQHVEPLCRLRVSNGVLETRLTCSGTRRNHGP